MTARRRCNIMLPMEGMAGSSVKDIARDMVATAKRLDLAVSLKMNGTFLLAFPDSTIGEIKADYETQLDSAK